jgi:hypothetical protein
LDNQIILFLTFIKLFASNETILEHNTFWVHIFSLLGFFFLILFHKSELYNKQRFSFCI